MVDARLAAHRRLTLQAAAADLSLVEAVKKGDARAARALLAQKADVNAAEADGTTALHWAVETTTISS